MSKVLFIGGAHKTGTSTMVQLLNSHNDIFIFYEGFIFTNGNKRSEWRLNNFLNKHSDCSFLKDKKFDNYNIFANKFNYKICGDKIPLQTIFPVDKEFKLILMVREIKTWLAKPYLKKAYLIDQPTKILLKYIYYYNNFLKKYSNKDILIIDMNEYMEPEKINKKVFKFLNLDKPFNNEWWNTKYSSTNPKNNWLWTSGHVSSINPPKLDINVIIKEHDFWVDCNLIYKTFLNKKSLSDNYILNFIKKYELLKFNEIYEEINYL